MSESVCYQVVMCVAGVARMAAVRITADDTRLMFMIYRGEAKRGECFIPMSATGNLIKKL